MANPIDLIVTQEALKQVDSLISKVTLAREGLLELGNAALGSSKNVAKITTPSGLNNNTNANAQINADIKKQAAEIAKLHEVIAKSAEKSRLAEIKLQQAREKSFDNYEKKLSKEAALAEKNANAYNKTQTQINRLTAAYNDLSIRKTRYNNLTENEEKRLQTLTRVNEKYNGILKNTDAQIGKNQRNVGNYASGWNSLGNSINQLTREAPAFANSMQTGFMAISNNIPALFDALAEIRNKLKSAKEEAMEGAIAQGVLAKEQALLGGATEEAATALGEQARNLAVANAEGVKGKGVFKQLGAAIFSLGTLLSVGVTLLTIYGKDLVELAFGLSDAEKAQKSLKDGMNELNNATSDQTVVLRTLSGIVMDTTNSEKERKIALTSLKDLVPELNKADIDHADTLKDVTFWTNKYIEAAINRAKADGLIKMISEEQTKVDTLKNQSTKDRIKWYQQIFVGLSSMVGNKKNALKIVSNSFKEEENALSDNIEDMSKMLEIYILKAEASEQKLQGLKTKPSKEIINAKKEEADALRGTEKWYNEQINKLKEVQSTTADTTDEYKAFTTQIELLEKALKALKDGGAFEKPAMLDTSNEIIPTTLIEEKDNTDPNAWMKQYAEDVKKAEEETRRLKEATDNWIGSFSSDLLQNSGLGSLETFFDGTFDKLLEGAETTEEKFAVTFNAIAESAQEAFNFIANASQANFDNERKRIEDQQAIAISYAGGSAVAIAKINEDAEKRKKEVANRENKAKQKQAIFNIAIDTAQAIIASVAKSPETFGLPFSAFAATIGAVQIGLVASQKIPQYFDGGVHEQGGLAMINDAKGNNYVETVVTPDGKARQFSGRDVVTNLPKGTEIFTPEQWHEKQILAMMQGNNINISANKISNSITKNDMDNILGKHFSNIKTQTMNIDKKGFTQYIKNGNSTTILNNARFSGTGLSI